jgi:hypothetical protein
MRYLLFAGDDYYPRGGMADLAGDYDTKEQAMDAVRQLKPEWFQIVENNGQYLLTICNELSDV